MPVRPRISRIFRRLQAKNDMNVLSGLDGNPLRLVRNRAPTLRHFQFQPVNEHTVFRSIVKINPNQKLLPRRDSGHRVRFFLRSLLYGFAIGPHPRNHFRLQRYSEGLVERCLCLLALFLEARQQGGFLAGSQARLSDINTELLENIRDSYQRACCGG